MPKVKLTKEEIKRLSILLERDSKAKKMSLENIQSQEWSNEERKERYIFSMKNDIDFQLIIKEKLDSEIFGK